MNKLISKNPVLRFKLGKKILKMEYGGLSSNEKFSNLIKRTILKSPVGGIYALLGGRTLSNKDKALNNLKQAGYINENNQVSSRLLNLQIENSQNKSLQAYKARRQLEIDAANKKSNIPINNVWLNGYRHDEIKDIRAMQNKLIELGLLKDRFGADGRWGDNTEKAYQSYLRTAFRPTPNIEENSGPIERTPVIQLLQQPVNYQNDFALDKFTNYNQVEKVPVVLAPYTPLGFGALLAQAAKQYTKLAKQGGLLSRNPIERFKRNFRLVAQ